MSDTEVSTLMPAPPAPPLKVGVLAFAVPGALLALAWLALELPLLAQERVDAFLAVFPWAVLAVGVPLGVRVRRGRVVVALLALALAGQALARTPAEVVGADAARFAFAATAVCLPLDLAWLALARERGALTAAGLRRLAVIAAQPAVAAFLFLSYHPGLAALLERPLLPPGVLPTSTLPHSAVIAFAVALLASGVALARTRASLESGFFWAVVGSLAAVSASGRATAMYLATAGLILAVALVESTFAMAYRDPLTGLPGRRAFDDALAALTGRYAIAMVDIDEFKGVNDRYGHAVGDQVLRMLAARTAELAGARAFRYGGEEFALVFPGCARGDAAAQLDDWREAIAKADFALRGRNRPRRKPAQVAPRPSATATLHVTVSAGVAEPGGRFLKPDEVVRSADEALYRAKRAGRNRVCT